MDHKRKLEVLLNDYFNSETDYYESLKSLLQKGITIEIEGPKLLQPFNHPLDAFDFINVISNEKIGVGYKFSQLDHNIKLLFFEDDRVEFKLSCDSVVLYKGKTSFTDYSAYSINRVTPSISNKKVKYQIYLKLYKTGKERADYEESCVNNVADYALNKIQALYNTIVAWKNYDLEEDYPNVLKTLSTRLSLLGIKAKTEDSVKAALSNLIISDFGFKDIVVLTYLEDIFFKEKISNNKFKKQLDIILSARKKYYEDLCQTIKY